MFQSSTFDIKKSFGIIGCAVTCVIITFRNIWELLLLQLTKLCLETVTYCQCYANVILLLHFTILPKSARGMEATTQAMSILFV